MRNQAVALSNEKAKKAGLKSCSLNDILFPVENVKQTDFACNSDYTNDIFGYLGGNTELGIMGVKTRLNT